MEFIADKIESISQIDIQEIREMYFESTSKENILQLSKNQLEYIINEIRKSIYKDIADTDHIVEAIIKSPSFQNMFTNFVERISAKNLDFIFYQQKIKMIFEEIEAIIVNTFDVEKSNESKMLDMLSHLKTEISHTSHEKSLATIENHFNRIINNILNDENCLRETEFYKHIQNTFVTKQNIESLKDRIFTDHIVENIVKSSSFVNMFTYYQKQTVEMIHQETEFIKEKILDFNKSSENIIKQVHNSFVTKQNLESLLLDQIKNNQALKDDILNKIKNDLYTEIDNIRPHPVNIEFLSDKRIEQIVKDALTIYDADKIGLVDYAIGNMGGHILTTKSTERYKYSKTSRTVITPTAAVGDCWAFQNFPGVVVIKLINIIEIEAFSVEHISKLVVPNGEIDSAPKEFEVYGLRSENDNEPIKLGEYVYDRNGESIQFFKVQNPGQTFEIIELIINSNHGHPNYTCLYRFRVHGKTI